MFINIISSIFIGCVAKDGSILILREINVKVKGRRGRIGNLTIIDKIGKSIIISIINFFIFMVNGLC
ncbi:hypothetical protein D3Z60_13630 [Lachnospiraceae bacterium]|nr:hypothetical protein [Lachnospiraceae bacterium]